MGYSLITCSQQHSTLTLRTSPTSAASCHRRPTSPSSTPSDVAHAARSSHTLQDGTATSPLSTLHSAPVSLVPHHPPPLQPRPLLPMTMMTVTFSAMTTRRRKRPSQRRPHRRWLHARRLRHRPRRRRLHQLASPPLSSTSSLRAL